MELNETLQPENTIIDLGNAERAKNVIELHSLGWKPGNEWVDKVSEILKSPLSKLEDRQVNEGPVTKEEVQRFPDRGSIEFNIKPKDIWESSGQTYVDVQPEKATATQTFGRKMEAEDIGQSPFDIDRSASYTEDLKSSINFKLLFGWIGSGLFNAVRFAKEVTTETVQGVKKEAAFKIPEKEDPEKMKEKQVKAKKKGNQRRFFNNLVTLVSGNPDSTGALDAKRAYVNKKVGLSEGFKETMDEGGQIRTDIEILFEKKESEEAQKQEKMVKRAEAQSVQGPQINIDAAMEGGTGKGGVANISSQAAG